MQPSPDAEQAVSNFQMWPRICRKDNQDIRREPSRWTIEIYTLSWWLHLCEAWAHFHCWHTCKPVKTEGNGSKNKNKLGLCLLGGVCGITHHRRSPKVRRFGGEKPIWRNLWHGCGISNNTPQPYFLHECQLKILSSCPCTCPTGFIFSFSTGASIYIYIYMYTHIHIYVYVCVWPLQHLSFLCGGACFHKKPYKNEHNWILGWSERSKRKWKVI